MVGNNHSTRLLFLQNAKDQGNSDMFLYSFRLSRLPERHLPLHTLTRMQISFSQQSSSTQGTEWKQQEAVKFSVNKF